MLKKFLVFIFISFLLAGCTSDKIDISMNNGNVRAIRDYEGTIVELPEKPKRILTLSLGFDVMTLGIVPPDRLVAVHKTAPDPGISWIVEESRQIPVKLYFYPFETVLKLKPDLIIASTWTKPEMIQGYRDLGFSVIVCKEPDTVDEVKKTILMIADAVNEQNAGVRVITEIDRQLDESAAELKNRKEAVPVGMLVLQMTSYGGKGCMFDELCSKARVCNGIAEMGLYNGQFVPKELVVACDPDFFMVSAPRQMATEASRNFQLEYFNDPALQGLRGLNNIKNIPDRYLYSATQNCVYAIKGIANAAYGNIFDMSNEHLIKGY